ncbi:MAG: hypothetical protein LBV45_04860 [Xanthomonadaceae bacterium]|jgi:hypothetical protein|nr:hypothetical protein [Xanthomonadaceae bacterium]
MSSFDHVRKNVADLNGERRDTPLAQAMKGVKTRLILSDDGIACLVRALRFGAVDTRV